MGSEVLGIPLPVQGSDATLICSGVNDNHKRPMFCIVLRIPPSHTRAFTISMTHEWELAVHILVGATASWQTVPSASQRKHESADVLQPAVSR